MRWIIGDLIKLRSGTQPLIIVAINGDHVTGMYCSGNHKVRVHHAFEPYDGDIVQWQIKKWRESLSGWDYPKRVVTALSKALDYYENAIQSPARGNNQSDQGENDMKALYEWKTGDVVFYGHKLAVNSAGQWVMETKQGDIHTVDKKVVSEVMPYTVDCQYFGNGGHPYSFFAKQGDVEVGDVILHPTYDSPMVVVKLDTKSKSASKWLEGVVVQGKKLTGE